MNEILDEDLTKNETSSQPTPYYRWSNIAAAVVIVGALLQLMHWPNSSFILHIGVSAHIGIELGFLVVLKGRSIKNKRRLIAAPFLLFFLSEWDLGGRMFSSDLKWILVASVILLTGLITYFAVKQKLKRLDV